MLREPQHERSGDHHLLGESPFALSAAASAAVEGFRDGHLPVSGSEIRHPNIATFNPFKGPKTHKAMRHQATESVGNIGISNVGWVWGFDIRMAIL